MRQREGRKGVPAGLWTLLYPPLLYNIFDYLVVIHIILMLSRNEDPVLAKNRIRGLVPQTEGDFISLLNE